MKNELAKIIKLIMDKTNDLSITPFEKNVFEDYLVKTTRSQKNFWDENLTIAIRNFSESVVLSKENKLVIAKEKLNEGFEKLSLITNKLPKYYGYTFAFAALSYWDYKMGNYDSAESKLWKAIKIDSFLCRQGIEIFTMHQIQQIHNIARIHFRKGDFTTACRFVNKALSFLLLDTPVDLYINRSIQTLPKGLKDEMIWQITSETIKMIHDHKLQDFQTYYEIAFRNLNSFKSVSYHENLHLQWFSLKELYYQEKYPEFLSALPDFISNIDRNYIVYIKNIFTDLKELNYKLLPQVA
jgi:tetratricopeptide (TPR) repeat protein